MSDCRDAITDYPDLSQSDPEAEDRYNKTKQCDPFPEISPALLNSADIYDYVRMTGMLYPFDSTSEKLKAASYEACIYGECRYWDGEGTEHKLNLGADDQELVLHANSITFVQVEPYFRLPDYIAIRFNLKITHVHRGILLGTGPLVDPGYVGKLLIPLHNLTTNEYTLKVREPLIWIEFTKISENILWDSTAAGKKPKFQQLGAVKEQDAFPIRKAKLSPLEALVKASPHKPIRSSIPDALEKAKKSAETAGTAAKRARNITVGVFVAVGVGLLAAGATIVIGGADILTQLNTRIQTTSEFAANALAEVRELRGEIKTEIRDEIKDEVVAELATTLEALKKEQTKLENDSLAETSATRKEISQLRKRISELMSEIEVLTKRILSKESKPEQPAN